MDIIEDFFIGKEECFLKMVSFYENFMNMYILIQSSKLDLA